MYIEELHIDGFGPLAGVRLRFDAQAIVIWGPNEAGKSTLLRFMRSMLYGFATRAQLPERGEPVGGGRHGGRLVLRDERGRQRILERYADAPQRKGAPVATLREAEGGERRLTQAEVERLLLGGVSEQLFRQLYAVSLDELHELRSLKGDEIGNFLYHAGMAGGAALTAAGKRLRAEMDRLYRPKGSIQEMGELLARIRELESRLRQGRQGLGAYQEALERLAALNDRAAELERALPQLRAKAAEAQGALDGREWWLRASSLRAEEEAIAEALTAEMRSAEPLPAEAAAEWRQLSERKASAGDAARQAAAERGRLEAEYAGLSWDERLVDRAGELAAMDVRGDALEARRGELAGLESDIRLAEEAAAAALLRLGPGWREADAEAVAALGEREEARVIGERLAEEERRRELLAAEAQRLRRQLAAFDQEAERRIGQAAGSRRGVYRFKPDTRDGLLHAWHRLDDALQAAEAARRECAWAASAAEAAGLGAQAAAAHVLVAENDHEVNMRADRGGGRRTAGSGRGRGRSNRRNNASRPGISYAAVLLLAAGAAAALIAALVSRDGRFAYAALAAALAIGSCTAAWAWRRPTGAASGAGLDPAAANALLRRLAAAREAERRTRSQAGDALRQLLAQREAEAEAAASLDPEAAAFDESEGASEAGAAGELRLRLRDEVYGELDRLGEAEAEQGRLAERQARREALARELAGAESELAETVEALRAVRADWSAWLAARRLPAQLQPAALPELGQLAEQALQQLRQRARLAARADALRAERDAFRAAVAALLAACPPAAHSGGDAALAVKLLHREAREQLDIAAAARGLEERLRQAAAAEAAAMSALETAEAAASAVIRAAGADSEDAYALRLEADGRRRILRRERAEAELRLSAGRGEAELQSLLDLLEAHDEGKLAMLAEEAREAVSSCEAERAEVLDARGRLSEQLERLRREAETEETAFELEEQQAELERLAERYTLLAATAELIRRTRVTFEEERQPAVLRQASAYFAELTEGRYTRIAVPGDTPDLLAETEDRRIVGSAFLSRGTQEQLYLSLRLALAGAASREQALPLLLDDLFVHYDEARLKRCVNVLNQLAENRQVLLFTCHRHVAETLSAGMPGSQLLKLTKLTARQDDNRGLSES
ncbi:AAA family ATPase [Cohnella hashimotonis]|uniref:AAA family ATPase n=1 Tax=Cohnella hashimotonis TaxID=2826895 RepID=A0ABT6TF85_9BACL|nr:AAA family ATPase [Cohnella hashimotonis]MDI4644950.1 AAA family ATPase [Cohnella hashimotonis]